MASLAVSQETVVPVKKNLHGRVWQEGDTMTPFSTNFMTLDTYGGSTQTPRGGKFGCYLPEDDI